MFQRKIYDKLLNWKTEADGHTALLIEGARRIGKSTIVEEFAKNEYESYILIDFAVAPKSVKELFEDISDLNYLFDLTQGEFGERIGISQHAVFDLEKDNTKLTPFSAGRIEEQFNIGKDWLMFGDEGKKNYPLSEKLTDWLWKNENIRKELWERMERDNKNEEKNVET